jgi:hypothetical protein
MKNVPINAIMQITPNAANRGLKSVQVGGDNANNFSAMQ